MESAQPCCNYCTKATCSHNSTTARWSFIFSLVVQKIGPIEIFYDDRQTELEAGQTAIRSHNIEEELIYTVEYFGRFGATNML